MKANERLIRTEASARIAELMDELCWLKRTTREVRDLHERLRRRMEMQRARIEAKRQSV